MVVFFVFMLLLLVVNLWGGGFSFYLRGGQEIWMERLYHLDHGPFGT